MNLKSYVLSSTVEGSVLVLANFRLTSTDVLQWVLFPVAVVVIVLVNGLRFKSGDGVKFLWIAPETTNTQQHQQKQ